MINRRNLLTFDLGVETIRILRNVYTSYLQPNMAHYLAMFYLLNGRDMEAAEILADCHDSIKQAMNHLAEASEACFNAKDKIMNRNFFLASWHLSHARILVLLPTVDLLEEAVELTVNFLLQSGKPIDADAYRDTKTAWSLHSALDKKSERIIYGSGPSRNPRRPTLRQANELLLLIDNAAELIIHYQSILRSIIDLDDKLPTFLSMKRVV